MFNNGFLLDYILIYGLRQKAKVQRGTVVGCDAARDILTVWKVLSIDSSMEILNAIIACFHMSPSKLPLTILPTELQYIADLC